jgi:hypothetical protein
VDARRSAEAAHDLVQAQGWKRELDETVAQLRKK